MEKQKLKEALETQVIENITKPMDAVMDFIWPLMEACSDQLSTEMLHEDLCEMPNTSKQAIKNSDDMRIEALDKVKVETERLHILVKGAL